MLFMQSFCAVRLANPKPNRSQAAGGKFGKPDLDACGLCLLSLWSFAVSSTENFGSYTWWV